MIYLTERRPVMKKRNIAMVLIIGLLVLLLVGCGKNDPKSENEIKEDLNKSLTEMASNQGVRNMSMEIETISIDNRKTSTANGEDTVSVTVSGTITFTDNNGTDKTSIFNDQKCTLYYKLYDDGWELENIVDANNQRLFK